LGPNDPLPEEGEEEVKEEPVVPTESTPKGALDLADGEKAKEPVVAEVTGEVRTTDAGDVEKVADAYAGTLKDVEELKSEAAEAKKPKANLIEGLIADIGLVTLPGPVEVAQTFGIVLLLVAAYTGFVALVDLGAQTALGQVFEEFYTAARPEAPSL